MKIVEDFIEQVFELAVANPDGYEATGELRDRWYHGKLGKNETSTHLRFDFEGFPSEDELRHGKIVITEDMTDLIVNGDVMQTKDALLKAFSGERVRGQKVVELIPLGVALYREVRQGRVEYTLYLRPYIRWE